MAGTTPNGDNQITGINVTPLVDIMLVLLVIFMVTAAYIVKEAIEVDLPRAAAGGETTAATLTVVITKTGDAFLDGAPVTDEGLARKIRESQQGPSELQAIIAADRDARHGSVVHVLDVLKGLGITKLAIEIEQGER